MRLTAAIAQKRIRAAAVDSMNVILTDHAKERMLQRGFVVRDVYNVLRGGFVDDDPVQTQDNDWKCKITRRHAVAGRTVGVITVIVSNGKLIVKTIEWEDGQ